MAYLPPEDIDDELPFDHTSFEMDESEWQALLQRIAEEESERIDTWAGTVFDPESVEETLSGDDAERDGDILPLSNTPVREVDSVTVDDDLLDAEEYYVAETHLEYTGETYVHGWPSGTRNIDVAYEYGHDELPGPLRDGLIRLVRSRIEQRKSDGLESESSGDTSYSYRPSIEVRREVYAAAQTYEPPVWRIGGAII